MSGLVTPIGLLTESASLRYNVAITEIAACTAATLMARQWQRRIRHSIVVLVVLLAGSMVNVVRSRKKHGKMLSHPGNYRQ